MFNDLKVSSSVIGQVPTYFPSEYPNFINFLKDYYRFLETNGNPLDILNGSQKLVDIDTYTGIDASSSLVQSIDSVDTEIIVSNHVEFPRSQGLLKIDDEVIIYQKRVYSTDGNGDKITTFTGCTRGFTYNTLTYEDGFTSNNETTPAAHNIGSIVYNQSFTYILYFLEQLRSNYLVDFPSNILNDNVGSVNINGILKRAKDFYLSKGTPSGIEFYFKFLFQKKPELRNYKENLHSPSEATYQNKDIVRLENLDNFNVSSLVGRSITQKGLVFPVQTVENVFSFASQVYEFEISNAQNLLPTEFTVITAIPETVGSERRLYVDSTYGFPSEGFLRINQDVVTYTGKRSNYFECDDSLDVVVDNFQSTGEINLLLGDLVYDQSSLAVVSDDLGSSFVVYVGISDVTIENNNIGYQENDLGFVSNILVDSNLIVSGWEFNDVLPLKLNDSLVAGVTKIYSDTTSVYMALSSIPYYDITYNTSLSLIKEEDVFVKIPKVFNQSNENDKEDIPVNTTVGVLRDGTAILSWKSANTFIRGEVESVSILDGGSGFNVHNPPTVVLDGPTKLTDANGNIIDPSDPVGTTAEISLGVNGSVTNVYIKNRGEGYSANTAIVLTKSGSNDPNVPFRDAILSPLVVNGQISKIRILDPGTGYTAQPQFQVVSETVPTIPVDVEVVVSGSIYKVNVDNVGSLYTLDPEYQISKGRGASGLLTIENGQITNVDLVNGGQFYKSAPTVTVVDSSGGGVGAQVVSEFNSAQGIVTNFVITNPGLNYNPFTTTLVITEEGSGEILQVNVQRWNLLNNWDSNNNSDYNSSDGSFLLSDAIVDNKTEKRFSIIGSPKKLSIDGVIPNLTNTPVVGQQHSPIIGWALDGSPIYGPYGHSIANDGSSDIIKLSSGYLRFNANALPSNSIRRRNTSPGLRANYPMGSFQEDYYFVPNVQGLDSENGRFCVTPEYPQGVYAYFITVDSNNKKLGFPFFIGPKFKGKTFNSFNELEVNSIEGITGLRRYLTPDGNAYHQPTDTGNFIVESIPSSTSATVDSIDVLASGAGYKLGDVLEFSNTGTDGFGAAGYISTIKGQTIQSVSKDTFDYLEYDDENVPFNLSSTIETSEGYSATVHVVDQKLKTIYLDNVVNGPITRGTVIFDTSLTIDADVETEISGLAIGSPAIDNLEYSADLINDVDSVTGYLELTNYNPGSGTIANFAVGKYVQIGSEFCKIIQNFPSENAILVVRGVNNTSQEFYPNGTTVSIAVDITVFDSDNFTVGDIVQITNEKFEIVNINTVKEDEVVATKIVSGGGGNTGTFYLFFDGVLQDLNGVAGDVVQLGGGGEVIDLTFTRLSNISSNPQVQIGTNAVYDSPSQSFINVNILASTYRHTLTLKRGLFSSGSVTHYPRTAVNRLRFISGKVVKYDQNRILAKINSANNSLVQNDFVKIDAALEKTNAFGVKYNTATNPKQFEINTGSGLSASINQLDFYEKSIYTFTVSNPNSNAISIDFYGPSYDTVTQTTVIGRKYFDVNIKKTIVGGNITKFSIYPDDSDLTEYIMRISSVSTPSDYKDYIVNTISEPINGEYTVVSSNTSYFEVYATEDPLPDNTFNYTSNTIRYITRSITASGGINTATLTSGGFNYTTSPVISSINTVSGEGAILEPVSDSIGKINKIKAVSSGYGYSPDPTQKPSVIFPRILKIKNNFVVTSLRVDDAGEQYLFSPRVVLSGGGLSDNNVNHAVVECTVKNGRIFTSELIFPGIRYNSAPLIDVEKYYYAKVTSNGDISFKFAFNQYILEDDVFKFRAYYETNGVEYFVDSAINFYAKINSTTVSCREQPVANGTPDVNPMTQITLPNGANPSRYELISLTRKASITAIVSKSEFITGEKVTVNNNPLQNGYVTTNKGWQKGSSILRIENYNYLIGINDEIRGSDSGAFGIVENAFGISALTNVEPIIQTPKKFLDTKSFLSSSALRLQDSYRYQKFAYEIGTEIPYKQWKEGYQKAAHPTGYNLFARTSITNDVGNRSGLTSIVKVETNVNEVVSFRTKYNYLVTKNVGFDEVQVKNRLLTDVKEIDKSVVAAFNDISDQFNGVDTAFELKVINPNKPVDVDGNDVFITDYDVDQMVVILDNIIQTYGSSWIVTDADKTIRFSSSRDAGELLPSEVMRYRQVNDDTVVYCMAQTTVAATDTFDLTEYDSSPFPAGIFASIDEDNYMCFVDGALQENANFSISAGGGSPTITFGEVLPIGSELSVRYLSGYLKNEFTTGTVVSGTPIVLANKPSGSTSKHSYFVFVDGIVITTSDYDIDLSNNNLIFNYGFTYDTLIIIIDPLGVSLEEQSTVLLNTKYDYKVNDGQLIIPAGLVIKPEDYFIEIAGVVQTPNIVYETVTSGIRKINFFEPPQRYVGADNTVGRQFIGLLYQRSDADGSLGTTPNYQFDDISKNIIHTKEPIDNFIVGDFVIHSNELVNSRIVSKNTETTRVNVETGNTSTVAAAGTFDIVVNSILNIFVGDRVKFKTSFGLTSIDDDELEISAINEGTKTITLTNISSGSLNLTIDQDTSIRFLHHTLTVEDLNVDASIANRDNAYQNSDTVVSGFISSQQTNTITSIDEEFGVSPGDTVFDVDSAVGLSNGDYISIDSVEVVKITNISSNTLTVTRPQLNTNSPLFHGDNSSVRKIIPYTLTVQSFTRGFDSEKTEFILKEDGNDVFITSDKDIFVIVNGILQKRGSSYNLVEVGTSYSKLVFTEPPSDGTPFNCFYVGEQISIQSIGNQFNGIQTAFDLRDVNGEIFSLISKNSEVEGGADISANLILFIDGVYQIPSTAKAYPSTLSSFRLFGSLIEFSSPPKFGSDFEGYIFVGSAADYRSIDVDATVERGDILEQENEFSPRGIINILSSERLAVINSKGQKNTNPNSGINPGSIGYGWWLSNLVRTAKVRESLRVRRTLTSSIHSFTSGVFPLTGRTLYTTSVPSVEINNISSDLPPNPDDDTNQITFILPASANFGTRSVNASYTTFDPRNESIAGDKDELFGVKIGVNLPFDQIVKLDSSTSSETFYAASASETGGTPINDMEDTITYGASFANSAQVIAWDQTNQLLYVKLNDVASPIIDGNSIRLESNLNIIGPVVSGGDNLIAEYQSLTVGNELYYNF
jgi:hypothetical protein